MDLSHLPQPAQRSIAVRVHAAAERAIRDGHPWVFESAISEQSHAGSAGDIAVIFDRKKHFLAAGLYDPASPIRIRILQAGSPARLDAAFLAQRLQAAAERRAALIAAGCTGYRLVYGEADGLPGLVMDRYGDTLVMKLYTAAWFAHLPALLAGLDAILPHSSVVLRLNRGLQTALPPGLTDGMALRGQISGDVAFIENGLHFAADVLHGHKTGFFFDQRENRARVRSLAQGCRVLDVFAYSGGFSVYAAAGGAMDVTSLDISLPALQTAQANMRLNQHLPAVAACQHHILAADAFDALRQLGTAGRRFDLVVVDPPSFAKKQDEVEGALSAYRRLAALALPLVERGGILMMASCSSRITAEQFFDCVQHSAQRGGFRLQELERSGHALDHPVHNDFPEGSYLKCLFSRVQ